MPNLNPAMLVMQALGAGQPRIVVKLPSFIVYSSAS